MPQLLIILLAIPIIKIIIVLALVGFLLWLILTYIPIVEPFRKIIIIVVVVAVVIWLLQVTGLIAYIGA